MRRKKTEVYEILHPVEKTRKAVSAGREGVQEARRGILPAVFPQGQRGNLAWRRQMRPRFAKGTSLRCLPPGRANGAAGRGSRKSGNKRLKGENNML